jgi:hypothetical protein
MVRDDSRAAAGGFESPHGGIKIRLLPAGRPIAVPGCHLFEESSIKMRKLFALAALIAIAPSSASHLNSGHSELGPQNPL